MCNTHIIYTIHNLHKEKDTHTCTNEASQCRNFCCVHLMCQITYTESEIFHVANRKFMGKKFVCIPENYEYFLVRNHALISPATYHYILCAMCISIMDLATIRMKISLIHCRWHLNVWKTLRLGSWGLRHETKLILYKIATVSYVELARILHRHNRLQKRY